MTELQREKLNKILEEHKHWIDEDCENWEDMDNFFEARTKDMKKILTTMENNMNVKFTIVAVILSLMFTSCIKLDEEISKETVFVTTTIVSKHYEEPKTELKYQFIMGKYQWLPSTEPAHYYVDYEYVLEDISIKKKIDDSFIFNNVEVGDKVFTSFTKLTMKSNKTGELYNKYFFNKIELQ